MSPSRKSVVEVAASQCSGVIKVPNHVPIPRYPVDNVVRCSFCGKVNSEVEFIVAGPMVFICSECIELCNEIAAEYRAQRAKENEQTPEKESKQ